MKNEKDLLRRVNDWIETTPENEVKSALAFEGVGDTTIRLLLKGEYSCRPGSMLKKALINVLRPKAS